MKNKNTRPKKIIWMDLEMTGLNPNKQRITEVGVIITDFELNELDTYEAVISWPESVLDGSDNWVKENHGDKDGLFDLIRKSEVSESKVIGDLVSLIERHFGGLPAVLAGNSIHQDRRFIRKWWPEVDSLLHYRMLDISSLKVYMFGKFDIEFKKQNDHRAIDDIRGSIEELQYYERKLKEVL